ncbi:MAG TPA: NAD(P)/FAD-dependent oxidoreductase [Candidatus Binataceae bacterium]|nr:NAD(P)/FAD-dependent oxidoreductase [Candidatus Binataceae bacterium]
MDRLPSKTEVFVVGGGPAGLAAAIAARQRGFEVVVADSAQPPIDKACGEGLMPDAVAALARLGVAATISHGFPFHGIRFVEDGSSAEACFPGDHGLGIRRPLLHRLLVERALADGVVLRWATPVNAFDVGAVTAGGRTVRCRWVIGADGYNSRVGRWAALEPAWSSVARVGQRQHFRVVPWTDYVEVHWSERCHAYVTPVGPDEVCVALIGGGSRLHILDLPTLFPELGWRLAGAEPTSSVRGAISVSTRLRRVIRGRLALIGDASGSVDAITGEGLALAFRQATVLAEALSRDDLTIYQAAHQRIVRLPRLMSRLMLGLGGRSRMRRRALHVLARWPRTFNRLLAVHVGALQPAAASLDFVGFAWRLLTASPSGSRYYP